MQGRNLHFLKHQPKVTHTDHVGLASQDVDLHRLGGIPWIAIWIRQGRWDFGHRGTESNRQREESV